MGPTNIVANATNIACKRMRQTSHLQLCNKHYTLCWTATFSCALNGELRWAQLQLMRLRPTVLWHATNITARPTCHNKHCSKDGLRSMQQTLQPRQSSNKHCSLVFPALPWSSRTRPPSTHPWRIHSCPLRIEDRGSHQSVPLISRYMSCSTPYDQPSFHIHIYYRELSTSFSEPYFRHQ